MISPGSPLSNLIQIASAITEPNGMMQILIE